MYPFPYFNGATVEVWEWINDYIPHFLGMWSLIHAAWVLPITGMLEDASGRILNSMVWNTVNDSKTVIDSAT